MRFERTVKRLTITAPRTSLVILLLLLIFAGCEKTPQAINLPIPDGADRALRESPQLTLFSLDPGDDKGGPGPRLQGSRILGETLLSPEDRRRVTEALRHDISHWNYDMALCFYPRHAIRATNNGTNYDFLICYECSNLEVFDPSHNYPTVIGITGSGKVFNEVLRAANIPISTPPAK